MELNGNTIDAGNQFKPTDDFHNTGETLWGIDEKNSTRDGSVILVRPDSENRGKQSSLHISDSSKDQSGTITGGLGYINQNAFPDGWRIHGGGVSVTGNSIFSMDGGNVTGNLGFTGGIYASDGSYVTLTNVRVNDNLSYDHGGGLAAVHNSHLVVNGGEVSHNITGGQGAAVWIQEKGSTLKMYGTKVEGNVAFNGYGVIDINRDSGNCVLDSVSIIGNKVPNFVVGSHLNDGSLTLKNCTIQDNDSLIRKDTNQYLHSVWGAVWSESGNLILDGDQHICGNKTTDPESLAADKATGKERQIVTGSEGKRDTLQDVVHTEEDIAKFPLKKEVITKNEDGVREGYRIYECPHCHLENKVPFEETIQQPAPEDPTPEEHPAPEKDPSAGSVSTTWHYTRADAIGQMWEHYGRPEAGLPSFPDVRPTHRWAKAIGWAQSLGIARADVNGNFRPDDPVLHATSKPEGELEEFLNRDARVSGVEMPATGLFYDVPGADAAEVSAQEGTSLISDYFARKQAALKKDKEDKEDQKEKEDQQNDKKDEASDSKDAKEEASSNKEDMKSDAEAAEPAAEAEKSELPASPETVQADAASSASSQEEEVQPQAVVLQAEEVQAEAAAPQAEAAQPEAAALQPEAEQPEVLSSEQAVANEVVALEATPAAAAPQAPAASETEAVSQSETAE